MKTFYVYAYLREDGSPYYIGKGTGRRAWKHCSNDSIQPPNDLSRIAVLEKRLTNLGALALERRLIRWYGRVDNQTGILRNLTDGGEGTAGYQQSNEHIQKRIKRGADHPNYKPQIVKEYKCQWCGALFTKSFSAGDKRQLNEYRFCSHLCGGKGIGKERSERHKIRTGKSPV